MNRLGRKSKPIHFIKDRNRLNINKKLRKMTLANLAFLYKYTNTRINERTLTKAKLNALLKYMYDRGMIRIKNKSKEFVEQIKQLMEDMQPTKFKKKAIYYSRSRKINKSTKVHNVDKKRGVNGVSTRVFKQKENYTKKTKKNIRSDLLSKPFSIKETKLLRLTSRTARNPWIPISKIHKDEPLVKARCAFACYVKSAAVKYYNAIDDVTMSNVIEDYIRDIHYRIPFDAEHKLVFPYLKHSDPYEAMEEFYETTELVTNEGHSVVKAVENTINANGGLRNVMRLMKMNNPYMNNVYTKKEILDSLMELPADEWGVRFKIKHCPSCGLYNVCNFRKLTSNDVPGRDQGIVDENKGKYDKDWAYLHKSIYTDEPKEMFLCGFCKQSMLYDFERVFQTFAEKVPLDSRKWFIAGGPLELMLQKYLEKSDKEAAAFINKIIEADLRVARRFYRTRNLPPMMVASDINDRFLLKFKEAVSNVEFKKTNDLVSNYSLLRLEYDLLMYYAISNMNNPDMVKIIGGLCEAPMATSGHYSGTYPLFTTNKKHMKCENGCDDCPINYILGPAAINMDQYELIKLLNKEHGVYYITINARDGEIFPQQGAMLLHENKIIIGLNGNSRTDSFNLVNNKLLNNYNIIELNDGYSIHMTDVLTFGTFRLRFAARVKNIVSQYIKKVDAPSKSYKTDIYWPDFNHLLSPVSWLTMRLKTFNLSIDLIRHIVIEEMVRDLSFNEARQICASYLLTKFIVPNLYSKTNQMDPEEIDVHILISKIYASRFKTNSSMSMKIIDTIYKYPLIRELFVVLGNAIVCNVIENIAKLLETVIAKPILDLVSEIIPLLGGNIIHHYANHPIWKDLGELTYMPIISPIKITKPNLRLIPISNTNLCTHHIKSCQEPTSTHQCMCCLLWITKEANSYCDCCKPKTEIFKEWKSIRMLREEDKKKKELENNKKVEERQVKLAQNIKNNRSILNKIRKIEKVVDKKVVQVDDSELNDDIMNDSFDYGEEETQAYQKHEDSTYADKLKPTPKSLPISQAQKSPPSPQVEKKVNVEEEIEKSKPLTTVIPIVPVNTIPIITNKQVEESVKEVEDGNISKKMDIKIVQNMTQKIKMIRLNTNTKVVIDDALTCDMLSVLGSKFISAILEKPNRIFKKTDRIMLPYVSYGQTTIANQMDTVGAEMIALANASNTDCGFTSLRYYNANLNEGDLKKYGGRVTGLNHTDMCKLIEYCKMNVIILVNGYTTLCKYDMNSDMFAVVCHNSFLKTKIDHWSPAYVTSNAGIKYYMCNNQSEPVANRKAQIKKYGYNLTQFNNEFMLVENLLCELEFSQLDRISTEVDSHLVPFCTYNEVGVKRVTNNTMRLHDKRLGLYDYEVKTDNSDLLDLLNMQYSDVINTKQWTAEYNRTLNIHQIDAEIRSVLRQSIIDLIKLNNISDQHGLKENTKVTQQAEIKDSINKKYTWFPADSKIKNNDAVYVSNKSGSVLVKRRVTYKDNLCTIDINGIPPGTEYTIHILRESTVSLEKKIYSLTRRRFTQMNVSNLLKKFELTLGHAGTGKTTKLVNMVKDGDVLIAKSRAAVNNLKDRVLAVTEIMSFEAFMTTDSVYKGVNLFVDEGTMVEWYEMIYFSAHNFEKIYIFGDTSQIGVIDTKQKVIGVRHTVDLMKMLIDQGVTKTYLNDVYRFNGQIFDLYKSIEPAVTLPNDNDLGFQSKVIFECTDELNIIKILDIIKTNGIDVILTTYNEVAQFLKVSVKGMVPVETIHSYQSKEANKVLVVQKSNSHMGKLPFKRNFVVTALTRARELLYWLTVSDNKYESIVSTIEVKGRANAIDEEFWSINELALLSKRKSDIQRILIRHFKTINKNYDVTIHNTWKYTTFKILIEDEMKQNRIVLVVDRLKRKIKIEVKQYTAVEQEMINDYKSLYKVVLRNPVFKTLTVCDNSMIKYILSTPLNLWKFINVDFVKMAILWLNRQDDPTSINDTEYVWNAYSLQVKNDIFYNNRDLVILRNDVAVPLDKLFKLVQNHITGKSMTYYNDEFLSQIDIFKKCICNEINQYIHISHEQRPNDNPLERVLYYRDELTINNDQFNKVKEIMKQLNINVIDLRNINVLPLDVLSEFCNMMKMTTNKMGHNINFMIESKEGNKLKIIGKMAGLIPIKVCSLTWAPEFSDWYINNQSPPGDYDKQPLFWFEDEQVASNLECVQKTHHAIYDRNSNVRHLRTIYMLSTLLNDDFEFDFKGETYQVLIHVGCEKRICLSILNKSNKSINVSYTVNNNLLDYVLSELNLTSSKVTVEESTDDNLQELNHIILENLNEIEWLSNISYDAGCFKKRVQKLSQYVMVTKIDTDLYRLLCGVEVKQVSLRELTKCLHLLVNERVLGDEIDGMIFTQKWHLDNETQCGNFIFDKMAEKELKNAERNQDIWQMSTDSKTILQNILAYDINKTNINSTGRISNGLNVIEIMETICAHLSCKQGLDTKVIYLGLDPSVIAYNNMHYVTIYKPTEEGLTNLWLRNYHNYIRIMQISNVAPRYTTEPIICHTINLGLSINFMTTMQVKLLKRAHQAQKVYGILLSSGMSQSQYYNIQDGYVTFNGDQTAYKINNEGVNNGNGMLNYKVIKTIESLKVVEYFEEESEIMYVDNFTSTNNYKTIETLVCNTNVFDIIKTKKIFSRRTMKIHVKLAQSLHMKLMSKEIDIEDLLLFARTAIVSYRVSDTSLLNNYSNVNIETFYNTCLALYTYHSRLNNVAKMMFNIVQLLSDNPGIKNHIMEMISAIIIGLYSITNRVVTEVEQAMYEIIDKLKDYVSDIDPAEVDKLTNNFAVIINGYEFKFVKPMAQMTNTQTNTQVNKEDIIQPVNVKGDDVSDSNLVVHKVKEKYDALQNHYMLSNNLLYRFLKFNVFNNAKLLKVWDESTNSYNIEYQGFANIMSSVYDELDEAIKIDEPIYGDPRKIKILGEIYEIMMITMEILIHLPIITLMIIFTVPLYWFSLWFSKNQDMTAISDDIYRLRKIITDNINIIRTKCGAIKYKVEYDVREYLINSMRIRYVGYYRRISELSEDKTINMLSNDSIKKKNENVFAMINANIASKQEEIEEIIEEPRVSEIIDEEYVDKDTSPVLIGNVVDEESKKNTQQDTISYELLCEKIGEEAISKLFDKTEYDKFNILSDKMGLDELSLILNNNIRFSTMTDVYSCLYFNVNIVIGGHQTIFDYDKPLQGFIKVNCDNTIDICNAEKDKSSKHSYDSTKDIFKNILQVIRINNNIKKKVYNLVDEYEYECDMLHIILGSTGDIIPHAKLIKMLNNYGNFKHIILGPHEGEKWFKDRGILYINMGYQFEQLIENVINSHNDVSKEIQLCKIFGEMTKDFKDFKCESKYIVAAPWVSLAKHLKKINGSKLLRLEAFPWGSVINKATQKEVVTGWCDFKSFDKLKQGMIDAAITEMYNSDVSAVTADITLSIYNKTLLQNFDYSETDISMDPNCYEADEVFGSTLPPAITNKGNKRKVLMTFGSLNGKKVMESYKKIASVLSQCCQLFCINKQIPNVTTINAFSFKNNLKYFDCIIHHGGAGITNDCITQNMPQIIIPFFGDQAIWANAATVNSDALVIEIKDIVTKSVTMIDYINMPASARIVKQPIKKAKYTLDEHAMEIIFKETRFRRLSVNELVTSDVDLKINNESQSNMLANGIYKCKTSDLETLYDPQNTETCVYDSIEKSLDESSKIKFANEINKSKMAYKKRDDIILMSLELNLNIMLLEDGILSVYNMNNSGIGIVINIINKRKCKHAVLCKLNNINSCLLIKNKTLDLTQVKANNLIKMQRTLLKLRIGITTDEDLDKIQSEVNILDIKSSKLKPFKDVHKRILLDNKKDLIAAGRFGIDIIFIKMMADNYYVTNDLGVPDGSLILLISLSERLMIATLPITIEGKTIMYLDNKVFKNRSNYLCIKTGLNMCINQRPSKLLSVEYEKVAINKTTQDYCKQLGLSTGIYIKSLVNYELLIYDYDNYKHHTFDFFDAISKAKSLNWLGQPVTLNDISKMEATHMTSLNKLVYEKGELWYVTKCDTELLTDAIENLCIYQNILYKRIFKTIKTKVPIELKESPYIKAEPDKTILLLYPEVMYGDLSYLSAVCDHDVQIMSVINDYVGKQGFYVRMSANAINKDIIKYSNETTLLLDKIEPTFFSLKVPFVFTISRERSIIPDSAPKGAGPYSCNKTRCVPESLRNNVGNGKIRELLVKIHKNIKYVHKDGAMVYILENNVELTLDNMETILRDNGNRIICEFDSYSKSNDYFIRMVTINGYGNNTRSEENDINNSFVDVATGNRYVIGMHVKGHGLERIKFEDLPIGEANKPSKQHVPSKSALKNIENSIDALRLYTPDTGYEAYHNKIYNDQIRQPIEPMEYCNMYDDSTRQIHKIHNKDNNYIVDDVIINNNRMHDVDSEIVSVPTTNLWKMHDLSEWLNIYAPYNKVSLHSTEKANKLRLKSKYTTTEKPEIARPVFTEAAYEELRLMALRVGNVVRYRKDKLDTEGLLQHFIKAYWRADYKNYLIKYKNNPVTYNYEKTKKWLDDHNFGLNKYEQTSKFFEKLFRYGINKTNFHIKLEALVKEKPITYWYETMARPIIWQDYCIAAIYSPMFMEIKDRLKEISNNKFVYADGLTSNQLSSQIRECNAKYIYDNDLEKQDRQTDEPIVEFEMLIYRLLGMDVEVLNSWITVHKQWKCKGNFASGRFDWMRLSGQATTAIGNVITNMQVHAMFFSENFDQVEKIFMLGDDLLSFLFKKPEITRLSKFARDFFNMKCTPTTNTDYGVFLRYIIHRDSHGNWSLGPDIVRIKNKHEVLNGTHEANKTLIDSRNMSYITLIGDYCGMKEICEKNNYPLQLTKWYDFVPCKIATCLKYNISPFEYDNNVNIIKSRFINKDVFKHTFTLWTSSKIKPHKFK